MDKLEQFKADRKEALSSLDKVKLLAYLDKYDSDACAALTTAKEEIFWKAVHMAITGAKDLPIEFRHQSKMWLKERGSFSLDDGDLKTSACCKELAVVAGGRGVTHWYECSKCGNACDLLLI